MFNLPNNTPYYLLVESDNGYIVITTRWSAEEGGEMGPQTTFETYIEEADALEALGVFMAGKHETD